MGTQILEASGWRPDCTRAQEINIERSLPPKPETGAPFASPTTGVLGPGAPQFHCRLDHLDPVCLSGVGVHVGAFSQNGCGASCACVRIQNDAPITQGWVWGLDPASTGPPAFVAESALLHALKAVEALRTQLGVRWQSIEYVKIQAGNNRTRGAISNWFEHGALNLHSTAASEIAVFLKNLKSEMECPVFFSWPASCRTP